MKNLQVRVTTPFAARCNSQLFSGWGVSPGSAQPLQLCAAVGLAESGDEVIALLDEMPPATGASVTVRDSMVFSKPKKLAPEAAAQVGRGAFAAVSSAAFLQPSPRPATSLLPRATPAPCRSFLSSCSLPPPLFTLSACRPGAHR
jgi:hypothetical protein